MARYANWHRGQVENLVPVGSNPTRATPISLVRWSNGYDSSLTKRERGFDSLRDDSPTPTLGDVAVSRRDATTSL